MASEAGARADARIAGVQEAEGWGSIEGFAVGCQGWKARKGGGGCGGGGGHDREHTHTTPQQDKTDSALLGGTEL